MPGGEASQPSLKGQSVTGSVCGGPLKPARRGTQLSLWVCCLHFACRTWQPHQEAAHPAGPAPARLQPMGSVDFLSTSSACPEVLVVSKRPSSGAQPLSSDWLPDWGQSGQWLGWIVLDSSATEDPPPCTPLAPRQQIRQHLSKVSLVKRQPLTCSSVSFVSSQRACKPKRGDPGALGGSVAWGFHSPKRTKHTQDFSPAWEKLAQKSCKGALPWAWSSHSCWAPNSRVLAPPPHPVAPGGPAWALDSYPHGPHSQERDIVMVRTLSPGLLREGNPTAFSSEVPGPETPLS